MSRFIIIVSFISCSLCYGQSTETTKSLINKMHQSILKYQDLRFTLFRAERKNYKFVNGRFDSKLSMDPFRVYIKNTFPSKGSEILYIKGRNNDKAWVNPNAFPYITLSLDPEGKLLIADGHHSLKETGFTLFSKMFKHYQFIHKEKFYAYLKYFGTIEWEKSTCHKFILNYPDYKIMKYTAKKGENLYKIASKLLLNIAKLKELNPSINDKKELIAGQQIRITNAYGKKAVFYLDSKSFLPVYQEIYDAKGLYEKYAYTNIKYGKQIPAEEFSTDYKDYNF